MTNNILNLSTFAATDWKDYSLYTLEERALPSIVDSLKPSQRYIIASALKNAKDKFAKVVEIAGVISSYGYHHAETAAQDACVKMVQDWNNNVPLMEGRGNFGSRLVQEASSPRYIYAKLHKNFFELFDDFDILPKHSDLEIKIPKYYLPLIPVVLLNGIKGTATGYATNILPYDIKDVTRLCKEYISGKDISKKKLTPCYPNFKGKIEQNIKGGWDLIGTWEQPTKTKVIITEVPFQYDRESYIQILDDLEEKEHILNYQDQCDENGFKFTVTLKRDFSGNIEKVFKLRRSVTENLNVINHDGKLKEYQTPIDLIKDFCDFRLTYVKKRIDTKLKSISEDIELFKAKIKFIKLVIDNKIIFKNKTKKQLSDQLVELNFNTIHIDQLLSMNFYHLSNEEIEKLNTKIAELMVTINYLKSTTPQKEYLIDIDRILKECK